MPDVRIVFSAETAAALAAVNRLVGTVQGQLVNLASSLVAGLSAGAFVHFIEKQIEAADQAGKTAQKIGLSTESFSAYAYAAAIANVEQGEFTIGLKTLSQNIVDAARKQQLLAGVAVLTNGALRSMEEILPEIANQFAAMPDGIAKTDLAVQLFGRAGQNLIPLLNEGAAGLQKLKAEALAAGVVISGETARAAEEFNDDVTRLKFSVSGLGLSIAQQLLPYLQQLVDALKEVSANAEKKQQAVTGVVGVLKGLGIVAAAVTVYVGALGRQIGINVALAVEQLVDNITVLVRVSTLWYDTLGNLLSRVLQLGLSLGSLGTALRALASGDFAEAKRAALEFKDQAADAAKGLGTDLSAGIRAGLDQADGFLRRSSGRAKVWWDETKDNVLSNWAKISGTFQTLFGGTSSTSPQSPTKPAGAAASLSNPEAEKQVKELLAKVNADYEAAFSERQVIIDLAYAREITALNNAFVASKNLRVEDLANDEEYQRAKEQIEALYAQRSLQNARDAAQQKRDVAAGQLHNAALGMTAGGNALGNFLGVSDPYAGPKQTVATGNADLIGIQKDLLAAQQELADAATKSEDDRIRAQEKINALIEKQITTQQGVANAERNINAQRVQGVQSMFADMATIAKAFGKKGFEVAKGIAIAGAIIHTAEAAVIAYKNGLELGGPYAGWLLGPLFAGVATAAGAAQIATIASQQPATGYERGGLVTGGEKVIRVNETGRPEFVMNADATARNLSLLKSLNAARNRPIALPITSSTESLQANAPGLQQGGGGTAAPNVNVAAPPAQIVIVDSEEMAHQVLMSGRFKEAVVRTFKDNRGELGFET